MTDRTGCDTPESMEARTIERAMKRIEAKDRELNELREWSRTLRATLADCVPSLPEGPMKETVREVLAGRVK